VELLAISAFAELAELSAKALRLYANTGLLVPAWVDPHTGYRQYSLTQLPRARQIARLRRLDMPLARIREISAQPDDQHVQALAAYWDEQERVFAAKRELAEFLIDHLSEKRVAMFGLVERMALPQKWTAVDLAMSLERERGHGVVWVSWPEGVPPGWCGLQLIRQHDRIVFHRRTAEPALHRSALAHAAAHLLLGHYDVKPVEVFVKHVIGSDSNGSTEPDPRMSLDNAAADLVETEAAILADLLVS
jgi:DNA-binding transcriptional MerR regulator